MSLLLMAVCIVIVPRLLQWAANVYWAIRQRIVRSRELTFDQNYIDIRAFYVGVFKQIPCIWFVNSVDGMKLFDYILAGHAGNVIDIYQSNFYSWSRKRQEFDITVFRLANKVMIEVGDDHAQILVENTNVTYAQKLLEVFTGFKEPEKEEEYEINIITLSSSGLELKPLVIKPTELDIDMYYNDDFKVIDAIIKERFAKENDKGIVLLHGIPGTGKTTYLRHLIGQLRKRVLFVSPGVAGELMNPEFIDLLIDNPNAVLVIEDAENIIMDRKFKSNSSVSNLLNISDGLLSDCLNVQIICTFNSDLNLVDQALMRKGRLIARYEFGKLDVAKAKRLALHLGIEQKIERPMKLAEITNPGEANHQVERVSVIGFRRTEEMLSN